MRHAQDVVHELMDLVELSTPRRQPVPDVGVIAVGVGAELVQEFLVGAHPG